MKITELDICRKEIRLIEDEMAGALECITDNCNRELMVYTIARVDGIISMANEMKELLMKENPGK